MTKPIKQIKTHVNKPHKEKKVFEFAPQIQEHKPKPISKQTYINRLQKALVHSLFDIDMITAKAIKNDSFKCEFFNCGLVMVDGEPCLRLVDLDKQYAEHIAKVRAKQITKTSSYRKNQSRKAKAKSEADKAELHKQTMIKRSQSNEKLREASIKRIIEKLPKPSAVGNKRTKTGKHIGDIVTIQKTISITLEPIIINRQKRYVPIQFNKSVILQKQIRDSLKRIEKNYSIRTKNGLLKSI